MADRADGPANVAEQATDFLGTGGEAPLGEVDLRVAREQVEDALAG